MKKTHAISLGATLCALAIFTMGATKRGFSSFDGISGLVTEAMLSFSDMTVADATTSKHGLMRKYDGSLNHYLSGANSWATFDQLWRNPSDAPYAAHAEGDMLTFNFATGYWGNMAAGTDGQVLQAGDDPSILGTTLSLYYGKVKEASLTLTDNTTNNVSTTKHGFAPKLPNDSTLFLDGTGSYTAPGPCDDCVTVDPMTTNTTSKVAIFADNTGRVIEPATNFFFNDGTGQLDVPILTVGSGTAIAGIFSATGVYNPSAFNVNDSSGGVAGTNPKVLTLTVTGAAVGDAVIVRIPQSIMETGDGKYTTWMGFVSAADTVKISIYLEPTGAGSHDMASFTTGATVIHY